MKKNIYRILATAFAMALVVASPATSITSHAIGFNPNSPEDTTDYGKRPSNSSSDSSSSSSSDSGFSNYTDNSSNSYTDNSYNNYTDNSSNSYTENSFNNGSGIGFNANSPEDTTNYGTKPSNNANDITVGVTGGQKFRIVMNGDHKSYQIYHCGISKITFNVTDAKDNIIAYKTVTLEQGEDKLWYANITFAEGVDTKDFTVNVLKGDATYLSTELCVSGIKVNGVIALSTVPATDAK